MQNGAVLCRASFRPTVASKRQHSLNLNCMDFYAPNFVEVEEAYCFGPVRPSVHPFVCVLHMHSVKNR